jgi:hypothetical protein
MLLGALGAVASAQDVVLRDEGGVRVSHGAYGTRYEITTGDPAQVAAIAAADRDENVRFAAVMALDDRAQLARLERSATDPVVRSVAARKLARPRTAPPDPSAPKAAAPGPGDLARIARHDPSLPARLAAIGRLDDQRLLADIAAFDASAEARATALGRLHDEALLADIARNSMVPQIRAAASAKLRGFGFAPRGPLPALARADPLELVEAALGDPDAGRRLRAVDGIRDAADLARVAAESTHGDTRRRALSRLATSPFVDALHRAGGASPGPGLPRPTYLALMRDAAAAADTMGARHAAAWWVVSAYRGDQSALAGLARSDPVPAVRATAIKAVRSVDERLAVARGDAEPEVRVAALDVRFGEAALAAIALHDPAPSVRSPAAKLLRDQRTLVRIAREDPDTWVRWNALTSISDQPVLRAIARRDPSPEVRRHAVAKLTDDATLAALAAGDGDPNVRAAAVRRRQQLAAGPATPR